MMKRYLIFCLLVVGIFAGPCFASSMTEIEFEVMDLRGGRWEYTYTVSNLNLLVNQQPAVIEQFTIWFDDMFYDNLVITTPNPPAGTWDQIVLQPDPVLQDDGAYDALAEEVNPGIAAGETEGFFSVEFDWMGIGVPGSQYYEIILPGTSPLEVIDFGWTVPEPCTLLLLGLGGLLIKSKTGK